jgi:hypothetical protein
MISFRELHPKGTPWYLWVGGTVILSMVCVFYFLWYCGCVKDDVLTKSYGMNMKLNGLKKEIERLSNKETRKIFEDEIEAIKSDMGTKASSHKCFRDTSWLNGFRSQINKMSNDIDVQIKKDNQKTVPNVPKPSQRTTYLAPYVLECVSKKFSSDLPPDKRDGSYYQFINKISDYKRCDLNFNLKCSVKHNFKDYTICCYARHRKCDACWTSAKEN